MSYIRPESVEDLKECRRLGRERREKIRDAFLDLMTGSTFHAQELAHFKFVSSMFHLPDRVEALTHAEGDEARLELLVSLMLTCAELALDNKPVQSARSIEKDMMSRYESVARKPAAAGTPATSDTEPVPPVKRQPSQEYDAAYKRKRRANMNEEQLVEFRASAAQRQRERRARLKAAKTV